MTTDEEVNIGSVVTSPPPFNLAFQSEKDMPAIDCVDLFPNPPHQMDEDQNSMDFIAHQDSNSKQSSLADAVDEQADADIDHSPQDLEDLLMNVSPCTDNQQSSEKEDTVAELEEELITDSAKPHPEVLITGDSTATDDERKTPNQPALPVVSPALSLSSYYSSTESVSSLTSEKKKKRKRHCYTCDLHFRHTRELLDHLKSHVTLPAIQVQPIPENDILLKEYRERQKSSTPDSDRAKTPGEKNSNESGGGGGLKLKLKLSGSQNFQVVPINSPASSHTKKENITRILTAREIKTSPPPPSIGSGPLDAMAAFSELHLKQQAENLLLENKYFECPTLDGLDQFAEEVNSEVAEDLLKKLLADGQQMTQDNNDWSVPNTNEFISIDRLAYMCTVCNSNFTDPIRLHEHRRITGHNGQQSMQPPPIPNAPSMGPPIRMRPNFPPMPPPPSQMMSHGGAPMQPPYCGGPPAPMGMRPNFPQFQHRFPMMGPGFNQTSHARRAPPPLYPNPQNPRPLNMVPFAEMNPEMYIPSSSGNVMMNGHHFRPSPSPPMEQRQSVFLKARLQRPSSRPRTPGMNDRSPNITPPIPAVLSNQVATCPRFLTPMHGPPIKKIKQEKPIEEFEFVPQQQPRKDGLPVIQSVKGGATASFESERPAKEPIQLNDQITLSVKNKEQSKNPQDVASLLATRGIIVTHKPKNATEPRETSPKSVTQEAVQKLQLNNSVSIISKKRPLEAMDEMGKPRSGESAFISCPVGDCEEKFLTQEGLNRHTQRGHKIRKLNLKAFKCKLCPAMFSTQEGLIDHQRKNHRILKTTADELGIPIIDLRNEQTKQKLAQLGIVNYIPLNAKSANGCFGFPIVSVQGAANPNICNVMGMGVSSLLSLGPIKQIPLRKMD